MSEYYSKKIIWKIMYRIWPPVVRLLELVKIHNSRQDFLLGHLSPKYNLESFKKFLLEQDFEFNVLSYRDPGEILAMRKLDSLKYQYHIRLFNDGEIRGHYEYAPEAKPIAHSFATLMESKKEYFEKILKDYII